MFGGAVRGPGGVRAQGPRRADNHPFGCTSTWRCETRGPGSNGQLQLSSVNLAGSGLRPVTRSSAMAESTFDAKVFLLGSRSASIAWAGGAKPVEIGALLAQPASKPAKAASAPDRSAQRRLMSTARSGIPPAPSLSPATVATPAAMAKPYPPGPGWQAQRARSGICPPRPTQQRVNSETTHSHVFLVACLTLSPAFFICSTVFSLACLARSTMFWGGASGAGAAGAAGLAGTAGASREVGASGCDKGSSAVQGMRFTAPSQSNTVPRFTLHVACPPSFAMAVTHSICRDCPPRGCAASIMQRYMPGGSLQATQNS